MVNNMKVIDLLNKIANGEEVPKKVKYEGDIYEYDGIDYQNDDDYEVASLMGDVILCGKKELNDEVEIIEDTPKEDKKIEKLIDELTYIKLVDDKTFRKNVVNKINELVDKVNGE